MFLDFITKLLKNLNQKLKLLSILQVLRVVKNYQLKNETIIKKNTLIFIIHINNRNNLDKKHQNTSKRSLFCIIFNKKSNKIKSQIDNFIEMRLFYDCNAIKNYFINLTKNTSPFPEANSLASNF